MEFMNLKYWKVPYIFTFETKQNAKFNRDGILKVESNLFLEHIFTIMQYNTTVLDYYSNGCLIYCYGSRLGRGHL